MWQNAGLCGVDSFYRALRWEGHAADDDDDGDGEDGSDEAVAYVRTWLHNLEASPGSELRWPPRLRAAVARPRPPADAVARVAAARREQLRDAYWAAGLVSRTGVRVANCEAVAVGRHTFDELDDRLARRASKRDLGLTQKPRT